MSYREHFLRFMNDGLDRYADDERVASIHAYIYPLARPAPETFFLRGADCWGWATWRRAWEHFNPDGKTLLQQLEAHGLTRAFDFDGTAAFTEMLENQIRGLNNSWAIRWHAACFLDGLLTLYPGRSLVHNIGNDGSGTHRSDDSAWSSSASEVTDYAQSSVGAASRLRNRETPAKRSPIISAAPVPGDCGARRLSG